MVVLCVGLLFWRAGALEGFVYANFWWPIQRYSTVNAVTYGYGVQFYWNVWRESLAALVPPSAGFVLVGIMVTPFLILAALPGFLLLFAIRYRSVAFQATAIPYWLVGSAVWLSEIHRKDIPHLAWGSPILIVLCFHLYGRLKSTLPTWAIHFIAICSCILVGFNFLVARATPAQEFMTRRGAIYSSGPDKVLEFLNTHVRAGEPIFVYPYHPMYYYLAAVENPTRYSILMYNMNTRDQFCETVRSLEQNKVRYVVWDTAFERERAKNVFPGYKVPPQQELIIEPYLFGKYRVVDELGGIRIMERR
jgi:hypothetical protein